MVERRPRRRDSTSGPESASGRGRGFVTIQLPLPRYVIPKRLKNGSVAYFFNIPSHYRKLGCPIVNEALGSDYEVACGRDGKGGKAAALNARLDEWNQIRRGRPIVGANEPRHGTVDWLFREYRRSKAYTEKVSLRSRPDYERIMRLVTDMHTKKGDKVGQREISAISPRAVDKIYDRIIQGPRGERLRQGEKAVALCRKAWRVVHRLNPKEFNADVPNPWQGVTLKKRVKKQKSAVTREQVYAFAWGCIKRGRPEVAAVAVICFEWLQRPENVLGGHISWPDYRNERWPTAIRIFHHKTGKEVWHPLEERAPDNSVCRFYEEAEEVLAKVPRLGVPIVLREVRQGVSKTYSFSGMAKIVQKMRKELGLPTSFTLDACRHGGLTELEEAELTDGQGRALSAHKSQQAYEGYAKRTMKRALAATRKRYAHRLTNTVRTEFQNGDENPFQNGDKVEQKNQT
jgi:hypothetical protein